MLLHLLKTLNDVAESTSVVLSEGDSIRNVYEFTKYSCIMAYGSTPYVGMTPKKNGGHIKSAQMTRSKCLR